MVPTLNNKPLISMLYNRKVQKWHHRLPLAGGWMGCYQYGAYSKGLAAGPPMSNNSLLQYKAAILSFVYEATEVEQITVLLCRNC